MRLVFVVFAGRQANLELQRPFIDRLLDAYPGSEYHLWDLTRTPEDGEYVRAQASERVIVHTHLHTGHPIKCVRSPRCQCMIHRPLFNEPYRWYAGRDEYADVVFVKLDDDVIYLETDRFGDMLTPLVEHPGAVVSANVVNNVVCAKYNPDLVALAQERLSVGDPTDRAADEGWWWLHTDPQFARLSHEWMLAGPPRMEGWTRPRPGERVSINCIAFTHPTMKRIVSAIGRERKLGDEGAIDRFLPRLALGVRAAHLTFGPQDKDMSLAELDDLRARYAALGKEYLGG